VSRVRLALGRLRGGVRRVAEERGYTLPELMTTMSILLVVLTGITSLFVAGSRAQADLTARFDAQTELRVGLDKMRREIHSACDAPGAVAGSATTTVTLSLPSGAGACGHTVTWCTQSTANGFGLYRVDASSVCSGGVRYSDFLTAGSIFTYESPNSPAASYLLARLHVDMTLDARQNDAAGQYHVVDDIVFRNSQRS